MQLAGRSATEGTNCVGSAWLTANARRNRMAGHCQPQHVLPTSLSRRLEYVGGHQALHTTYTADLSLANAEGSSLQFMNTRLGGGGGGGVR